MSRFTQFFLEMLVHDPNPSNSVCDHVDTVCRNGSLGLRFQQLYSMLTLAFEYNTEPKYRKLLQYDLLDFNSHCNVDFTRFVDPILFVSICVP